MFVIINSDVVQVFNLEMAAFSRREKETQRASQLPAVTTTSPATTTSTSTTTTTAAAVSVTTATTTTTAAAAAADDDEDEAALQSAVSETVSSLLHSVVQGSLYFLSLPDTV